MVKDLNRGGNFVSKTAIEIDPNTGVYDVANGGTVFAKLGVVAFGLGNILELLMLSGLGQKETELLMIL